MGFILLPFFSEVIEELLSAGIHLFNLNFNMYETKGDVFNMYDVLHELKHFLPAQAPLKDFIHHNTLHVFQHKPFFEAIRNATHIFGYKTSLSVLEYRELYTNGKINDQILERVIAKKKGKENVNVWKEKLVTTYADDTIIPRIGRLRSLWKKDFKIDIDSAIQPTLFRMICSYLDQGIALWQFPVHEKGLLASLRELEEKSLIGVFKSPRAKQFILAGNYQMVELLDMIVGSPALYKQYLFDQQFSHPGWSGIVSVIEDMPNALLDRKNVTLQEFIIFELLLELDTLDSTYGEVWKPLGSFVKEPEGNILAPVPNNEYSELIELWQEAFEWTYFDEVLAGLNYSANNIKPKPKVTCPHCGRTGGGGAMIRNHFDKCKNR